MAMNDDNQIYVRNYVNATLLSLAFISFIAGSLLGIGLTLFVWWEAVGLAIFFLIPALGTLFFVGKAAYWINFADKITVRTLFGLYTFGFDEIEGWEMGGHDHDGGNIEVTFSTGPAWFYAPITQDQIGRLRQYLPPNKEGRGRPSLTRDQDRKKYGWQRRLEESIFGKPLVDPFFGELHFNRGRFINGPGFYEYWQGRVRFDATGHEIGITLPADKTGPTEEQRSLYREISSHWESMIEWLPEAIYPVYSVWFADSPQLVSDPQEMFQLLEVTGITIEHPSLYPDAKQFQDFEIGFFVPGMVDHGVVVHIKDWELVRASIE